MINIEPKELFDLNKIGLWVIAFLILIMLLTISDYVYLFVIEVFLLTYAVYLIVKINSNKNLSIMINNNEKWFVVLKGHSNPVKLKDYWLLKKYIFLWVKGQQNSVSFVVSRSIIGPQKYSQLRALIT